MVTYGENVSKVPCIHNLHIRLKSFISLRIRPFYHRKKIPLVGCVEPQRRSGSDGEDNIFNYFFGKRTLTPFPYQVALLHQFFLLRFAIAVEKS
jgi:hypothetical protein